MTTTRESALEAALNGCIAAIEHADMADGVCCCGDNMDNHSEPMNCGHSPVDAGEYHAHQVLTAARAALSTPATEPQGYVEGLEAATKNLVWAAQTSGGVAGRDEGLVAACDRVETVLAARPAPQPAAWAWDADGFLQPAADTRVVTVAQLDKLAWLVEYCCPAGSVISEIRAIIGNATPAPSDKIAEAARVVPISLLRQLNKLSGYVHENEIRQIIGEHEK